MNRLTPSKTLGTGPKGIVKLIETRFRDGVLVYTVKVGEVDFPCISEAQAIRLFDSLIEIEPVDHRARNQVIQALDAHRRRLL